VSYIDGKLLWLLAASALAACSGRTSSGSGQAAGDGALAGSAPEPREPTGAAGRAGQSSVAPGAAGTAVGSSGSGGMTVDTGEAPQSGEAADGAAGGERGTSSEAGSGGEPAVEFPARGVCGPAVNEYSKRYCPELEVLSIHLEAIEDEGGDGAVSAGEEAYAVFSLRNDSSQVYANGPCVGLLAAIPGFTVLESYNPSPHLYGVNPGSAPQVKTHFRVEPGVAPGTRIPLLAWLDVQGALCPNGDDLRFELRVAP